MRFLRIKKMYKNIFPQNEIRLFYRPHNIIRKKAFEYNRIC